ncbi:MAG: TetR/AcrR family transcriptional regulator [Taibaiella sp.]|nr:TetR/AcrR family transcriptional regulator [Taibaiella sp.]
MATRQQLEDAYIDHVLTRGERPVSVYVFAKDQGITEQEFYDHFASFDAIEAAVWTESVETTIQQAQGQEVWNGYSAREKALSFFYSYTEYLKSKRSFVVYSLKQIPPGFLTPAVMKGAKELFDVFANEVIQQGLESKELEDRPFFAKRYKDGLWAQFVFILNFWVKDSSTGFEKTDEAIEKGVNLTFDLYQRSPIDSMLEYGKFLAQNAGFNFSHK